MLASTPAADGLLAAVRHLNSTARDKMVRVWLLACSDEDAAAWRRLVEADRKRRQRGVGAQYPSQAQQDNVPLEQQETSGTMSPCPAGAGAEPAGQGQNGKESGFPPVPPSGKETSKKDPTGPKKVPAPTPESVSLPDCLAVLPLFPPTWEQFIESRRLIKKPMTHLAAERLLAGLAKRPADAVAGLDMAIEKQWQGFNWEWFDSERAPRNGTNGTRPRAPDDDDHRPRRCL